MKFFKLFKNQMMSGYDVAGTTYKSWKWWHLWMVRTGLQELVGQRVPRTMGVARTYFAYDKVLFVVMPANVLVRWWDRFWISCRHQKPNVVEARVRTAYQNGHNDGRRKATATCTAIENRQHYDKGWNAALAHLESQIGTSSPGGTPKDD